MSRPTAGATPILDRRGAPQVLAELLDRLAGYSAHWRPRPGASGHALLRILARECELVIAALDAGVDKGELAFLDALGIDLLAPQAARVPLVFELVPDSPIDPPLPEGTQVAAPAPPALASSLAAPPRGAPATAEAALVFASDERIALARARLVALYSVNPARDELAVHSEAITGGFVLFDGLEPVTHHLYLGHDTLFALSGSVDISIDFDLRSGLSYGGTTKSGKPKLPKGLRLAWEYLSDDGWVELTPVADKTYGLSREGEVQLHKRCGPDAANGQVDGVSSYWLRARMKTPLPSFGPEAGIGLPVIDSLRARVSVNRDHLPADAALGNDLRLDTTKDFLPFGPQPVASSTLLLACDEACGREGARIGIDIDFTPGAVVEPSADLALFWEYSAAPGVWKPLGAGDSELADNTHNLTTPSTVAPAVSFLRPPDWAKVPVNGEQHFWLRVRIDRGGFGGPPTYTVEDDGGKWKVVAHDVPQPPLLRGVWFSYTYRTAAFAVDHCLTLNGFAHEDFTDAADWGQMPFTPFAPLPDRRAAVYLGFDRPLPVGLVSLYVDVPGGGGSAFGVSPYDWEYASPDGWVDLAVLDETAGFARSGMIQLIGPPDAVAGSGPSGASHWIRARRKEATDPVPARVGAVYVNAVWATQRNAVEGEVIGHGDGTPRQAMLTQHAPVLERQLLEVQEWHGKGREWESLFDDLAPERLRHDSDPRGNVRGVWVTWEQRPHLHSSGPGDRHYAIERSSGLVRFGNGLSRGMVPPPGAAVMLSYDFGGGVTSNLATATISELHSSVPFVSRVTNPVPAAGGAAGETLARVRQRGPRRIRNAGRSVAREDYEWLAREASPEVAVARCLPATGPDGGGQPGWVTVLIIPQGEGPRPQPSQELLRRVEQALSDVAPAAIAGQLRVTGPTYQEVSVIADVVPRHPGEAAEIEERLLRALDAFLHPVTGVAGAGWEFGESVMLSQVVRVILADGGVEAVEHVALMSETAVFDDAVVIDTGALPCAGKHLVKLQLGVP
jgi:predicted phage baseplate assembly protein